MSAFIRFLIFFTAAYLIYRFLRRLFAVLPAEPKPRRHPEKEVRNASFREEDIEEAKFKDIP